MLDLIPARQRITVFKKNYRNSRQILRAASSRVSRDKAILTEIFDNFI
jgi:hypothetical protein